MMFQNKIQIRRDQNVLECVNSLIMIMNVVISPSQVLNPSERSGYLMRRLPPALSLNSAFYSQSLFMCSVCFLK